LKQELAVWRKQANLSVQEEFTGKPLPPDLEDSLPKTLPELFDTVRSGVRRSAETYITLCSMMERLSRRNEGMAAEYARFSSALSGLTESSQETYAVDTNDVPLLNEGMNATARHLDSSRQLLEDEARGWEEGVLEDLKRQRDTLVSVRDMFDRRDKYARDNIPQLEKRIANNESKLHNIRQKSADQIKPGEAEKVEDAIFKVSSSYPLSTCIDMFCALTRGTGQGIHCPTTCPRRLHHRMHPRRTRFLPKEPISCVQIASGVGAGTGQVRRVAG
jgi:sorting nexin-8